MSEDFRLTVGIDWAWAAHEACAVDTGQRVVGRRTPAHTGEGLQKLVEWLTQLAGGDPAKVGVAIELPHGPIVETLIERGFPVFFINPKQLDRFRDRYSMAGAKDDRRDAFVLATALKTDPQCFRRVRLDNPTLVQLRELSRAEENLKKDRRRLTNQLIDLLRRYFPQALALSPAGDEPWVWALLALAPTPEEGGHLRRQRIENLLKKHRIRKWDADGVITALRAPSFVLAPGTVEACAVHVRLLVGRLQLIDDQVHRCADQIDGLVESLRNEDEHEKDQRREHCNVDIIRSVPGFGRNVVATMLAEASGPLADRDYHQLRSLAGSAPVTRQSGKSRVVRMRRACRHRLREATYQGAFMAMVHDPNCKAYYKACRDRNQTHGRAIRALADRLLRMLTAMLRDGTLYDPSRWVAPERKVA